MVSVLISGSFIASEYRRVDEGLLEGGAGVKKHFPTLRESEHNKSLFQNVFKTQTRLIITFFLWDFILFPAGALTFCNEKGCLVSREAFRIMYPKFNRFHLSEKCKILLPLFCLVEVFLFCSVND